MVAPPPRSAGRPGAACALVCAAWLVACGPGGTIGGDEGDVGSVGVETSDDRGPDAVDDAPDGPCVGVDDDMPCDDGDPCTIDDVCAAEQCVGGSNKVCDETSVCHGSSCDPATGACVETPLPEGTLCGVEGEASCSRDFACTADGQCTGTPDCPIEEGSCVASSTCDVGSGECTDFFKSAGAQCDVDGVPCTTGECQEDGVCYHPETAPCQAAAEAFPCYDWSCLESKDECIQGDVLVGAECDDGDPCTEASACADDPDHPGIGLAVCVGDASCDDGRACTVDACTEDGCTHTPDDSVCADDDGCTIDVCDAETGECTHDPDVGAPCELLPGTDTQCVDAVCNEAGACGVLVDPTTGCDDGDPCTKEDVCGPAGLCGGQDYADECATGPAGCTAPQCDGAGGCLPHAIDLGWCVIDGACVGGGENDPDQPCRACDAAASATSWSPVGDGLPCDADGSGCTQNDACLGGVCTPGMAPDCDDGLDCTVDACVPDGESGWGCSHTISAGQVVIEGVCWDSGAANPDESCLVAQVDTWVPVTDGTLCDADSDGCTVDDHCQGGVCTPGGSPDCYDGHVCTQDVCVSTGADTYDCEYPIDAGTCLVDGACKDAGVPNPDNLCVLCDPGVANDAWTPVEDGQGCDADGNGCTYGDSCQAGVCEVGTLADCGDGLDCTVDACASEGSVGYTCSHEPVEGACAIDDGCHTSGDLDPTNPCMACSPGLAAEAWSPVGDGIGCDADEDGCTVGDACLAGVCTPGPPADCADDSTCTEDTCGSTGSNTYVCNHAIGSGTCLVDGQCYAAGHPNPDNPCERCNASMDETGWSPVDDGLPCNADDNGCTYGDACQAGTCAAAPLVDCADDKDCTVDGCDSLGDNDYACTHELVGGVCLIGSTCWVTGADHPDNPCQRCMPSIDSGAWSPIEDATPCDFDQDGCTVGDSCQGGQCMLGVSADCADELWCTVDGCESTAVDAYECTYEIGIGGCLIGGSCYANGEVDPDESCRLCSFESDPGDWTPVFDTTSCDADDNGCTFNDECIEGTCVPGEVPGCADAHDCTTDACVSTGPNTWQCGNELQVGSCMIAGACWPTGTPNPDNSCQVCDAAASTASWTPVEDGLACDADEDGCTVGDSCQAGVCEVGAEPDCGDDLHCTEDACVSGGPDTYACENTPLGAGASCAAADLCTSPNVCEEDGTCTLGAPIDCDDGIPCTVDSCDPAVGCVHTATNAACLPPDTLCTDAICVPGEPGADAEGCIEVGVELCCGNGIVEDGESCDPGPTGLCSACLLDCSRVPIECDGTAGQNFTLTNLQHIEQLDTCDRVPGDLEIHVLGYTDIENKLAALAAKSAQGGLALRCVGGDLIISNSPLVDLDFLANLDDVGGDLGVYNNEDLQHVDGLANVRRPNGFVRVTGNDVLQDVDGLIGLTGTIPVHLWIQDNPLLSGGLDGLQNITRVGYYLHIIGNESLHTIHGLRNLRRVDGPLVIKLNTALLDIDGLAGKNVFPPHGYGGITTAYDSVTVRDNPSLGSLEGLSELTGTIPGDLVIQNNTCLPDLDGIWGITEVTKNLTIVNNGILSQSEAEAFEASLDYEPPYGSVNNNGNGLCADQ